MNIANLLEHEAGWIERIADLADPDMVDEARALFAEVRRLRRIEDAARVVDFHTPSNMGKLERALEFNPRPDAAESEPDQ